ncbi:MAG: hypothetical protein U9Q66_01310 [Patescibacteria group bacterium]|nr:hypothetical protein [Patescibacteria group bacterium]
MCDEAETAKTESIKAIEDFEKALEEKIILSVSTSNTIIINSLEGTVIKIE